jgi:hypothetical protein
MTISRDASVRIEATDRAGGEQGREAPTNTLGAEEDLKVEGGLACS